MEVAGFEHAKSRSTTASSAPLRSTANGTRSATTIQIDAGGTRWTHRSRDIRNVFDAPLDGAGILQAKYSRARAIAGTRQNFVARHPTVSSNDDLLGSKPGQVAASASAGSNESGAQSDRHPKGAHAARSGRAPAPRAFIRRTEHVLLDRLGDAVMLRDRQRPRRLIARSSGGDEPIAIRKAGSLEQRRVVPRVADRNRRGPWRCPAVLRRIATRRLCRRPGRALRRTPAGCASRWLARRTDLASFSRVALRDRVRRR